MLTANESVTNEIDTL